MTDRDAGFDLSALRAIVAADAGSPEFPALAEALRRSGDPDRARSVAEAGLVAAPGRLAGRVALGLALIDLDRSDEARAALAGILDAALAPHRLAPAESAVLAAGPDAGVDDDELERAFAVAEPQVDEMISPNRMAERVLLDQDSIDDPFDFEEDDDSAPLELDEEEDGIGAPGPAFQTATMAELLAKQGDAAGADAIRRELGRRSEPERAADAAVVPVGSVFGPGLAGASRREISTRGDEGSYGQNGTGHTRNGETSKGDASADRTAGRSAFILATLERWLQNIQRGRA